MSRIRRLKMTCRESGNISETHFADKIRSSAAGITRILFHMLCRHAVLYLCAILLLTACRPTGSIGPQENTAAPEIPVSEVPVSETEWQTPPPGNDISDSGPAGLQVHFVDVGQGDCTLVICGDEAMLIDAGDNDRGTAVQLYLQRQGVEKLTYLIGTHPDSDHIGGLDVILTKFDCGTVIMPEVVSDTASYRDVADAMEYRGYQNTPPHPGDVYSLGGAEFTIIAPNGEYEDDNNSSIGIKLTYGNTAFLFTGDAETEAEADMIQSGMDLKADVLHAGHHGSSTSCSPDFIASVSPAYAVFSCGRDNPYGHPHERVLDILKERGVQVFRTDEQGSIIAFSDGSTLTWNRAPSLTWAPGDRIVSVTPPDPPSGPETAIPGTSAITYVLNRNTCKFHTPDCGSVSTIRDSNREDTTLSREEVIAAGYTPCKICNP